MSAGRYRVLLLEDDPDDARLFREALIDEPSVQFQLETADTLARALERVGRGDLDLIVLDLTVPDSQGIETFNALQEKAPDVPMIVLTGVQDSALGLRAVREGAQDYLNKGDLKPAALVRSLAYAIERHKQQKEQLQRALTRKQGRIVAFMGARGGVGTTTVAHNVASVLARDHRTLLVEFSPSQETLSWYTCTKPERDLGDLLAMEPDHITFQAVSESICRLPGNLEILFSPQRAVRNPEIGAAHTESILLQARALAEYVILDLPHVPTMSIQTAARYSSSNVLVTSADPIAVQSAAARLGLLKAWGLSTTLARIAIVNTGRVAFPVSAAEVNAVVQCPVAGIIPPMPTSYESHRQSGMPVVIGRPDSGAALALTDLAVRLTMDPAGSIEP